MQKIYTVAEVAKVLRAKRIFVYDEIRMGRLRAFQLSPRRIRISEAALEEYLATREQEFEKEIAWQAQKSFSTERPRVTRGFGR